MQFFSKLNQRLNKLFQKNMLDLIQSIFKKIGLTFFLHFLILYIYFFILKTNNFWVVLTDTLAPKASFKSKLSHQQAITSHLWPSSFKVRNHEYDLADVSVKSPSLFLFYKQPFLGTEYSRQVVFSCVRYALFKRRCLPVYKMSPMYVYH